MPDTFIQLLSRVGTVALARATFGLLICVALALTSPSGIAGLLPAITAAYAVVGTLAFGRAVREEMHKDLANAVRPCASVLVHELCIVACVFALAHFEELGIHIGNCGRLRHTARWASVA